MTETTAPPGGVGNPPFAFTPSFNPDEVALILGTLQIDPAFVLDPESLCVVGANQRLLDTIGQRAEGLEQEFPLDRWVCPDDRAVFRTWVARVGADGESFSTRLLGDSGKPRPVEIHLRKFRWKRRAYCLGFVRSSRIRTEREQELQNECDRQRARAQEALHASMRLYEINEKTKSTLILTTRLLNVDREEQLFKDTVQVLTAPDGLNFREATVMVLEGSDLRPVCSTGPRRSAYSLRRNNRYARWIREGCPREVKGEGGEALFLVPLRSRDTLLGAVEVEQYRREREFFEDYEAICQWQLDMLQRIGDIIALLVENLRLQRELRRQSIIDPLTLAYNRNFFMARVVSELHRASRYGRPVSLVFIDVDRFKEINDRYGHLHGDDVLRDLGRLFKSILRDTDVLCRFGGDEFVMLLPEATAQTAAATVEKLLKAVREHHFPDPADPTQGIEVTVSAGISTFEEGQDQDAFVRAADNALYEAKRNGRNRAAVAGR